jgi:chemotaxis protein CheC
MGEIGNILLNACIGSIANLTNAHFDSTLPEFRLGSGGELLRSANRSADDTVLLVFIDFNQQFSIQKLTLQGVGSARDADA